MTKKYYRNTVKTQRQKQNKKQCLDENKMPNIIKRLIKKIQLCAKKLQKYVHKKGRTLVVVCTI